MLYHFESILTNEKASDCLPYHTDRGAYLLLYSSIHKKYLTLLSQKDFQQKLFYIMSMRILSLLSSIVFFKVCIQIFHLKNYLHST